MKSAPKKICLSCGDAFLKPKKYSATQWEQSIYCSSQCAGEAKKGVPRSDDTKIKLSKAHRGTKKPWAGKYIWGSPQENSDDMIKHGNSIRRPGEMSPNAKLTWDKVERIRSTYKPDVCRLSDLAEEYGVSFQLISLVVNRKIWNG